MTAGMARIFLLPVGILVALATLRPANAAPVTYDQRQEGKTNVEAKVENFLFVVGLPAKMDFLSELMDQALELKQFAARSKQNPGVQAEQDKEQTPEVVVYETEEAHIGREPYRVEIVHIAKEGESSGEKKSLELAHQAGDAKEPKKSLVALDEHLKVDKDAQSDAPVDEENPEKKGRSFWSKVDDLDEALKKQLLLAYRVPAASNYQKETLEESKDELLKSGKPGLSMKKQLSKEEEESMYLPLREELKLLGDAIENCGPERYRDSSGICQADKNFPAK